MNRFYNRAVVVFSTVFILLGFALLVETARQGGGNGYLLGGLFVALGAGRLVLVRRQQR